MTKDGPAPDPYGDIWGRWMRELDGLDQVERVRRGLWVHGSSPRPPVGLTPHEIVHVHDKLVLRHYPAKGERTGTPVVVVPSLINKAYVCDLEPGRSLVAGLAERGHDVLLVDWGVPNEEDADEDVGYVLLTLLHHSIERAARVGRTGKVHLFGYCMGGTLAAMYAALRTKRIASLTTLAAPVVFEAAGRFRDLVVGLDVDEAFPEGTLVPVDVMKPAFQLLDPMGNWNKFLGIEAASHDDEALRRAMVRERWLEENVPMPSAFAREFIGQAYQRDALRAGTWTLRGETVDLGAVTAPTMVVACEKDFVAPKEAVAPLADMIPGARLEMLPAGHIGVVVGSAGPKVFYPLLDRWFREVTP
ncbi:MAG: alpha/beta fold hydrolase [Myxococcales bacterium]|nr:alpha/beta fold hydrolase [Myxococcales bacterium]